MSFPPVAGRVKSGPGLRLLAQRRKKIREKSWIKRLSFLKTVPGRVQRNDGFRNKKVKRRFF